jgi:hypothetical protein
LDTQPGAPEHHDQAVEAIAVALAASLAHHRDDLIDRRRISGVMLTLVPRRFPGVKPWHGRGRASATGDIDHWPDR